MVNMNIFKKNEQVYPPFTKEYHFSYVKNVGL